MRMLDGGWLVPARLRQTTDGIGLDDGPPHSSMNSVEAVWSVRFGWLMAREQDWEAGILALFSNRMVGGDSAMAYLGNYETDGDQIVGKMAIMRHNYPYGSSAQYKEHELHFEIALEGTVSTDEIVGRLMRPGKADAKFSMRRFAALPGVTSV
jgi:hypothetical protein